MHFTESTLDAAKRGKSIDRAIEWSDVVTADVFTGVPPEMDRSLWLIQAHANAS